MQLVSETVTIHILKAWPKVFHLEVMDITGLHAKLVPSLFLQKVSMGRKMILSFILSAAKSVLWNVNELF